MNTYSNAHFFTDRDFGMASLVALLLALPLLLFPPTSFALDGETVTDVLGEEIDIDLSNLRIILLRTYLPTDGRENVPLPDVIYRRGDKEVTLPTCPWLDLQDTDVSDARALFRDESADGLDIIKALIEAYELFEFGAFPYCTWGIVVDNLNFNIAFPDAAATYWALPYFTDDDLELEIRGEFADQRYMSVTVYNQTFDPFVYTVDSKLQFPSYLADYEILPDVKGTNPFSSSKGVIGASYTMTIKEDPGKSDKGSNVLPASPSADGLGVSAGAIPMPAPCGTTIGGTSSPFTCTLVGMFSSPPSDAQSSVFSNPHNTYIPALLDFRLPLITEQQDKRVFVIRARLPQTPAGTSPVPWPNKKYDMRYWSLCTAIYERPYPTIGNLFDKERPNTGCIADDKIARSDAQGKADPEGEYFTVVVSTAEDKPFMIDDDPSVTWLEGVDVGRVLIILRNMLPVNFDFAAQNVIKDGSWFGAYNIMQDYYPAITAACSKEHYEKFGWGKCQAPGLENTRFPAGNPDPDDASAGVGLPGTGSAE